MRHGCAGWGQHHQTVQCPLNAAQGAGSSMQQDHGTLVSCMTSLSRGTASISDSSLSRQLFVAGMHVQPAADLCCLRCCDAAKGRQPCRARPCGGRGHACSCVSAACSQQQGTHMSSVCPWLAGSVRRAGQMCLPAFTQVVHSPESKRAELLQRLPARVCDLSRSSRQQFTPGIDLITASAWLTCASLPRAVHYNVHHSPC